MFENLKNLFKDFDFRLPTSLDDITPGFLTVMVCLVALIVIIVSVVVLSKKKKERLRALEQKERRNNRQSQVAQDFSASPVIYESDSIQPPQEPVTDEPAPEILEAAIRPDISYTASFAPVKVQPTVPHKPKSAAEIFGAGGRKTPEQEAEESADNNKLKIENGFVVVTSVQKSQLEKAYSIALRKCAVNGTSKDLEKLLEAKRMLSMNKIPQKDFEVLMALLFPQR